MADYNREIDGRGHTGFNITVVQFGIWTKIHFYFHIYYIKDRI